MNWQSWKEIRGKQFMFLSLSWNDCIPAICQIDLFTQDYIQEKVQSLSINLSQKQEYKYVQRKSLEHLSVIKRQSFIYAIKWESKNNQDNLRFYGNYMKIVYTIKAQQA